MVGSIKFVRERNEAAIGGNVEFIRRVKPRGGGRIAVS